MGEIDFDFGLAGRVAVVTGGASGIGQAIATLFAKKGAMVAIVDRDEGAAASQAAALGPSCKAFTCDVSDVAAIGTMAGDVVAAFGKIDILVNSAGVIHLAPAETLSAEAWDQTFEVNLRGIFLVCQSIGRHMIANGGGKIINLASQAGSVAIEQHVAYCAAKFGLIGLSKVLALEWGQHGITVNTLSPTVVLT
ncbi:MAG: SDR family NAD(P)-dependent oxidoreductase, partial [Alphaproteobacteria bacterium]